MTAAGVTDPIRIQANDLAILIGGLIQDSGVSTINAAATALATVLAGVFALLAEDEFERAMPRFTDAVRLNRACQQSPKRSDMN